jgi:hypothetical protein
LSHTEAKNDLNAKKHPYFLNEINAFSPIPGIFFKRTISFILQEKAHPHSKQQGFCAVNNKSFRLSIFLSLEKGKDTMEPDLDKSEGEEENLFHDLELRYISLRNEYESVCSERNNLEGDDYIRNPERIFSMRVSSNFFLWCCVLFPVLAARNKVLDDTITDLRGASDTSSSEASRHTMELKQVACRNNT